MHSPVSSMALGERNAIEGAEGAQRIALLFEGVEAYKCSYLTSCSAEMFNTAYGKLVSLGTDSWLEEASRIYTGSGQAPIHCAVITHMVVSSPGATQNLCFV
jgi:hypothetical protein